MKNRGWFLGVGAVCILLIGIFAVSTQGLDSEASLFHSNELLKTGSEPTSDVPSCGTPGGTTTPCSQIEAAENAEAQAQAQTQQTSIVSAPVYGPLTNLYSFGNAQGFEIKYPSQLFVSTAGGATTIVAHSSTDDFGLRVLDPSSFVNASSTNSLAAFEAGLTMEVGVSGAYGVMTLKDVPAQNSLLTSANGKVILKQSFIPKEYAQNGTDITSSECEECTGQGLQYIIFKGPSNFFVLQLISGSEAEADKLIESITY